MANIDQKLNIIIDAQNKAGSALGGVEKDLEGVAKKTDHLKKAFGAMAIGGTAAFAGIAAFAYKSVPAANESNKVLAQMEAVLKSTGGAAGLFKEDLIEQAAALQKLTTYGDEAIMSAQNMLLTFTQVKGPIFQDAIGTILDMSTALGTDLQSSAMQVGKALNDPIQGINALRRVGVSFSDAQQKVIEDLVKTGKTAEAQKLILKELAVEFGGSAAAAAGTFGGKLQQLQERLGDMQEGIGNALIPALAGIVEKIAPIVEKIIAWIEANPQLTATILIVTGVIAGLTAVIGALGLATLAFSAVAWPVVGIVALIVAGIVALVAIGIALYKNWDEITAFAKTAWEAIKNTVVGALQKIKDFFVAIWEGIKTAFMTYIYFIAGIFATLMDYFFPGWQATLAAIYNKWIEIWGGIKEFFLGIWQWIQDMFGTVGDFFQGFWDGVVAIFNWAKDQIGGVFDWIGEKIEPIFKLIDKLQEKLDRVGSAVKGAFNSVVDKGKALLGKKAVGGPVSVGHPYLVGENGPEVFTPSTSGRIAAGVGGMAIYVTIGNNKFVSPREEARMMGKEFVNYLKDNMRVG